MTDNLTLNQGSGGQVCAADDVSSVYYQRVKVTPGGDGVAAYGCTSYSYRGAASTNQDSQHPKGSPGVLYGLTVTSSASSVRYLRLYNLSAGATSASSVWRRYIVPSGGGIREQFPFGVVFDTGLGFRMTTGEGDTDATAITAGDLYLCLEYV